MGNKHIFFPLTKSLNLSAESWKVSVILRTLLMECLGHCPSINSSNAEIHHLWTSIVGTEPGQWASVFLLHFRSSRWVSRVWWEKWTENECRDEMAMNAIWHSALKELLIITTSSYPGDYCKNRHNMGPLQTSNKEQFNVGLQEYKYLHKSKWFWNGHLIYCLDNKKKIGNNISLWWTGKRKSCRGVTLPMLKLAASLEPRATSIIWLLTSRTGCYLQKPIVGLYAACWRNPIQDGCRPEGALCCFDHFTLQPSLHSNQMTSQCFLKKFSQH